MNLNPESLTNLLSNPKGGAIAVVIYSPSYVPSLEFLSHIKAATHDFPSVQLIVINADENRNILGLPVINVSEIPVLLLFFNGRPVYQPILDSFQAGARVRRLGLLSMETDDFEAVGTLFKVPKGTNLSKWKKLTDGQMSRSESTTAAVAAPLLTVMDSIYEI